MSCYWYKGHHIPDCWGAVFHGQSGCTCKRHRSTAYKIRELSGLLYQ